MDALASYTAWLKLELFEAHLLQATNQLYRPSAVWTSRSQVHSAFLRIHLHKSAPRLSAAWHRPVGAALTCRVDTTTFGGRLQMYLRGSCRHCLDSKVSHSSWIQTSEPA
jgi:hypothetical protein